MIFRRFLPVVTCVVFSACGGGRVVPGDGGTDSGTHAECGSDLDCPLGRECKGGVCVVPTVVDAGKTFICTKDDDCAAGQQCLKSTGDCIQVKPVDSGIPDAGPPPACSPGLVVSCGASKLGECKLGTTTCVEGANGWAFGPCVGATYPTSETCDGLDNDCNGNVDEGLTSLLCGAGACLRSVPACMMGMPRTCNPGTSSAEACNSIDDDCNGLVDDGLPQLTCGVGRCARTIDSCQGGVPQTCTPGSPLGETCNGLDDNCNGQVDDGLGTVSCGVGICARTSPACVSGTVQVCTPGTPSVESCNGLDDNCDGLTDNGLPSASCGVGACARTVASCSGGVGQACVPGAPAAEVCNGVDDNCNGQTDEGLSVITCGLGICQRTVTACLAGVAQTCTPGNPAAEACNGVDDNCNGVIDEGCNCVDGQMRTCYSGPPATENVGRCHGGNQTCVGGNWGACTAQVVPTTETCNGFDDDCNNQTDEGFGTLTCGVGVCKKTINACTGGTTQTCTPGAPTAEVCNGLDDNCNGTVDDGLGNLACGTGACARTVAACVSGTPQVCLPGSPATEICDGVDNNCNGTADEGLGTLSCGTGACTRTVAACSLGVAQSCTPGAPITEVCNGADDNCNGATDEGLGNLSCGVGICARTVAKCTGGVTQTCAPGAPATETCNGLDDDCNGTVDNNTCNPVTTCPANQTVNPNTTVTLNTNAVSPAGRPFSCAWSVVSRPATANGTFGSPTSCTGSNYFADVVGTHVLRFTVTDALGVTGSCDVTITVNPLGDLWVELTWNKPNDMDLHLLHPTGGNSHTAASWHTAWDCDWLNKTPSWDATGTLDDPSLDRDDIPGQGPENTRINVPSTAHAYTIGVHMFSLTATAPVLATVKIYCAGTLKTTLTKNFSTVKDMWVLGTVNFSGSPPGGCAFVPDGFVFNVP